MDKYEQEIQEVTDKVKADFTKEFEKKHHGRGYYNWTDSDDRLIELTVREMWRRK